MLPSRYMLLQRRQIIKGEAVDTAPFSVASESCHGKRMFTEDKGPEPHSQEHHPRLEEHTHDWCCQSCVETEDAPDMQQIHCKLQLHRGFEAE